MNFIKRFKVEPGRKVDLESFEPDCTAGMDQARAREIVEDNVARLARLQSLLWAERKHALLIVLQGMDAAGKDGAIRHVMSGVNPQGCEVTSFKVPSAEELGHDFLWRIHQAVPPLGYIGIFNRSQYEDVLVVRVHDLVGKPVWSARFDQINEFERMLSQNNVHILKFYLHISRGEQKKRLRRRLEDPARNWKIVPSDLSERARWREYSAAYADVLKRCSTPWAPWFVIPANHKWFRNLAVSQIVVETLKGLNMRFPKPAFDISRMKVE